MSVLFEKLLSDLDHLRQRFEWSSDLRDRAEILIAMSATARLAGSVASEQAKIARERSTEVQAKMQGVQRADGCPAKSRETSLPKVIAAPKVGAGLLGGVAAQPASCVPSASVPGDLFYSCD